MVPLGPPKFFSSNQRGAATPPELTEKFPTHDSFGAAGVPMGMIFIRNENGSHNPREAMTIDDFLAGLEIVDAVFELRGEIRKAEQALRDAERRLADLKR